LFSFGRLAVHPNDTEISSFFFRGLALSLGGNFFPARLILKGKNGGIHAQLSRCCGGGGSPPPLIIRQRAVVNQGGGPGCDWDPNRFSQIKPELSFLNPKKKNGAWEGEHPWDLTFVWPRRNSLSSDKRSCRFSGRDKGGAGLFVVPGAKRKKQKWAGRGKILLWAGIFPGGQFPRGSFFLVRV